MVTIRDGVALKRGGLDLDTAVVDRVDRVAALIDEPLESFALRRPSLVAWNLLAFVSTFHATGEVNERQVEQRWKAEHGAKTPLTTVMATDLTVVDHEAPDRHGDRVAHA